MYLLTCDLWWLVEFSLVSYFFNYCFYLKTKSDCLRNSVNECLCSVKMEKFQVRISDVSCYSSTLAIWFLYVLPQVSPRFSWNFTLEVLAQICRNFLIFVAIGKKLHTLYMNTYYVSVPFLISDLYNWEGLRSPWGRIWVSRNFWASSMIDCKHQVSKFKMCQL